MIFSATPQPPANTVWFTLLEVGQGLSAVVQTKNYVLVFDTGPKFSENYDMGQAVVIPFLRYQGIKKIDVIVISHPHNDHIGGLGSVLTSFPGTKVMTSDKNFLDGNDKVQTCLRGEKWLWDGVTFEFLYPRPEDLEQVNDSSCVLKISLGSQQVLLTGDIEKASEKILTENSEGLASTIIVVPHHGSKTSSTEDFLEAVNPKMALFPVGYLNRFHFPKEVVVERYEKRGVVLYDTANNGAISIKWSLNQVEPELAIFSKQKLHIWNH